MRLTYLATCARMTWREFSRRRLVLSLALLVPAVFLAVAAATTTSQLVPVQLASAAATLIQVNERQQSLLFISIAGAGLMAAFLATGIVQRHLEASRRLVLAGYRPIELIAGQLLVLLGIVAGTVAYTWVLLMLGAEVPFQRQAWLGLFLGALVYAAYGLLVGTVFRRDLESVFAILLLVNIDAGWLQNPLYYAGAESRWLIEILPAHAPVQAGLLAEFTTEPVAPLVRRSLGYAGVLFLAAIGIYSFRMRVAR